MEQRKGSKEEEEVEKREEEEVEKVWDKGKNKKEEEAYK